MNIDLPTVLVMCCMTYALWIIVLSRYSRTTPPAYAADSLFFVVLIPCLNEEKVIRTGIDRLMSFAEDNFAVMVIDDGSDDSTPDIVRSFDPSRVWLFQRTAPNARKGKGEALNAAYRHLRMSPLLNGRSHRDIIIVILDADGRLAPTALTEVSPYFVDPRVGGVQIGVRMYNALESLLARMQDVEFVTFTDLYQRGRQRIGSVGLGGNGQFNRLAALESLGDSPWTSCLTEDLDLGVQLLLKGWANAFCPTTHVSQQAVVSLRRLLKQRARWFQGHLQCWRRIPEIARSGLPERVVIDLTYHLISASLVLVMTFVNFAFVATLLWALFVTPSTLLAVITAGHGLGALALYLLAFGMANFYGVIYWMRTPDRSIFKCLLWTHLFAFYAYMWVPSGWRAVWRAAAGRRDWAKTARTTQIVEETFAQ